jgi:hypothetical protein
LFELGHHLPTNEGSYPPEASAPAQAPSTTAIDICAENARDIIDVDEIKEVPRDVIGDTGPKGKQEDKL